MSPMPVDQFFAMNGDHGFYCIYSDPHSWPHGQPRRIWRGGTYYAPIPAAQLTNGEAIEEVQWLNIPMARIVSALMGKTDRPKKRRAKPLHATGTRVIRHDEYARLNRPIPERRITTVIPPKRWWENDEAYVRPKRWWEEGEVSVRHHAARLIEDGLGQYGVSVEAGAWPLIVHYKQYTKELPQGLMPRLEQWIEEVAWRGQGKAECQAEVYRGQEERQGQGNRQGLGR